MASTEFSLLCFAFFMPNILLYSFLLFLSYATLHSSIPLIPLQQLGPLENLGVARVHLLKKAPLWMYAQLSYDFSPFPEKSVSLEKIEQIFDELPNSFEILKVTIKNNALFFDAKVEKHSARASSYKRALRKLAASIVLPNTTFLIYLQDGSWGFDFYELPLFVMCKLQHHRGSAILIPDFSILDNEFQVLKKQDVTTYQVSWKDKIPILIWRGSTTYKSGSITALNLHLNERVTLCKMSKLYPHLINANFTSTPQVKVPIPALNPLCGKEMSFEKQFQFKYHLLLDGNVSAYSASGWKFFTNSVIFKPDSEWVQWYYGALEPYVHYVPVAKNLSDLVEKIEWAKYHDREAKKIAKNTRGFALQNLCKESNFTYLYLAILEHSKRII